MRNGRWSKEMDFGEGNKANAGWPRPLTWFQDNRDFPAIIEGLRKKGFSDIDVQKIMGLNWLNQLEKGTAPAT
jgi:microsomal dipeptidase-like Zn-dependent dipeptidase